MQPISRKAHQYWLLSALLMLDLVAGVAHAETDFNLLYIKGRQLALDGDYEQALPLLEKAAAVAPDSSFIQHQLAEVYFRLGKMEQAQSSAEKAVTQDPKNAEYRSTLGGIFATNKNYLMAKQQYEKIMEIEPDNMKAPLLLGLLAAEAGKFDEGIGVLTKVINKNPDNYLAVFYRAKVYLEMDDIAKAQVDLDKCLTLRPAFVEAGTALGLIFEKQGKNDEAINAYERIQGNGRFKKRLAQLYLQKNEMEKALTELKLYESTEPDDYSARIKVGLIHFELKQYDQAKEKFNAILKEQPESDNVRFYLAAVFEEAKEYDPAVAMFKKVGPDSTFYKEAMLHVGLLYKDQGKIKEAKRFAQALVRGKNTQPEFIDLLASLHDYEKDYKSSLKVIDDGLKKFPDEERLNYFRGALFDKMQRKDEAIAIMKTIVEKNPEHAHALNFIGYSLAESGKDLEEAEKYVTRALKLRPNDGFIEDSLGWVLFKRGKTDEAVARLEKAASLQPNEAIIMEHLGDAYAAKKDIAKATEAYKKAVAITQTKDQDYTKKLTSKLAEVKSEVRNPSQAKD